MKSPYQCYLSGKWLIKIILVPYVNDESKTKKTVYIPFSKLLLILIFFTYFSQAHADVEPELLLSKEEVAEAIKSTVTALEKHYLYPKKAQQASSALLTAQKSGEFDRSFKFGRLKQKVETILISASGDSSFELLKRRTFSSVNIDSDKRQSNSIKVQTLENNIGYIELDGNFLFSDTDNGIPNALEYLAGSDAVIIDLRNAGDGSISLAQHVISYFVEPNTLLGNVYFNPSVDSERIYSVKLEHAPINYRQNFPIFILNSSFVAGPWEFLGYTLKHLHKATIVGEDTIGVATMKKPLPVSEHLSINIAYAQITHPVTDESWQQRGVFADYQTTAQESFEFAYQLALQAIEHKSSTAPNTH